MIHIQEFILFSIIEAIILVMFFEDICKLNKFKLHHIFIMTVGNWLINSIIPPLLSQGVLVVWLIYLLIKLGNLNLKQVVKSATYSVIFTLMVEVFASFVYNVVLQLDLNMITMPLLEVFIYLLPFKIMQIFIIKYSRRGYTMKMWFGKGVKK